MGKVVGIGGIFLKFTDPAGMRKWYSDVLGLTTNDYGVLFRFNVAGSPEGSLQLGTFEEKSGYFGSPAQQCMLNFRVDNMESLLEVLKQNKVEILNEMEEYEYGKFLHISDPEGNRIELWEAVQGSFSGEDESVTIMR